MTGGRALDETSILRTERPVDGPDPLAPVVLSPAAPDRDLRSSD